MRPVVALETVLFVLPKSELLQQINSLFKQDVIFDKIRQAVFSVCLSYRSTNPLLTNSSSQHYTHREEHSSVSETTDIFPPNFMTAQP